IDATYDEIIDETDGKIDVLINNAGGIFTEAKDTKEGIEQTFAINHLGPFLLTEMLMTFLLKSKTRIINVSSAAHTQANWSLQNPESKSDWKPLISYANAKICNIYTAKYWANKYKDQGITAYALHPGVVRTGFGNEFNGVLKILLKIFQLLMISAKKGAKTSIYLATASDISEHSGKYFAKQKVKNCSNLANDLEKQQQLIDYSNQKIEEILPR
ncbi:MAG: SDR family NAD(P)-dependent oxidoreductase, partial [Bacteroidia bacterium]